MDAGEGMTMQGSSPYYFNKVISDANATVKPESNVASGAVSLSESTKGKRGRPRKDRSDGIVGQDSATCKRGRPSGFGWEQKLASVGEIPGASQELSNTNLLGEGQGSKGGNNDKEWDSTSVMKAIIEKHGDITKSCTFQSQIFKTNSLEGICKMVKKLKETRLADINPGLLKEVYTFIEDAESVNLDVKWLRKHVDEAEEARSSLANELERLERAEREARQQNEERKKNIQVKRVEVAKLQSEIQVEEDEVAVGIVTSKDLKAQISCIKSRYHSSDYAMESLI